MSKLKSWTTAVLILLLIGLTVWYVGQNNHPFNKVDTFVYNEQGNLYWFEITGKQSSIEGTFHQRSISEEPGKVPVLDEKKVCPNRKNHRKRLRIPD
ncbi:hypothetical protein RWE15_09510 [Virgibacillus halophilus]|uniref:Uncharacterized protein n=1 Tax=Tigheibacillus halophilus TaxID=361280 RepID=A0ABU5C5P0_9BACI|nr:hypothetical protein [Virgibacillus halophilus]